MARRHTLVIAALLAFAVVGGSVALGRTLGLGAASTKANDAVVIARTQRLNRFEASLRRQLAKAPNVPAAKVGVPVARAAVPPRAQRVRYVRPAPIVVTRHAAGRDYEHEGFEHEGGEEDD